MRCFVLILSLIFIQNLRATELAINTQLSKIIWRANKPAGSFHNGFIGLNNGYVTIENEK